MKNLIIAVVGAILLVAPCLALAQDPPAPQEPADKVDVRAELREMRKKLAPLRSEIRKGNAKEAEAVLDEVAARIDRLVAQKHLSETNRAVVGMRRQIERYRELIAQADPEAVAEDTVSFVRDIAPIFAARCIACHGAEQPRGRLSLFSYATLARGGTSGRVVTPGKPAASLMLRRVQGLDDRPRMPRRGGPLSDEQIEKISQWITQGARCDAENPATPVNQLAPAADPNAPPAIDLARLPIAKPTGKETVNFVTEVAPTLVNICGGCHNRNQKRGGLSMETFAELLVGGDDGPVIVPGKPDDSLLLALVKARTPRVVFNGITLPRMPAGNRARLPDATIAQIETWIAEGASYSPDDPLTTLRSLVPTEEELLQAKLAAMSPDEITAYRLSRAEQQWQQANRSVAYETFQGEHVTVLGDALPERLEQLAGWADDAYTQLARLLGNSRQDPPINGKLTLFVFTDRFNYTEHGRMVEEREIERGVQGHHRVTLEDQYVCLQDTGDDNDPDTHARLVGHVTAALLKTWGGDKLPQWVVDGTATAAAAAANPRSAYYRDLHDLAWQEIAAQEDLSDLLADGAATSLPVSHSLAVFMLRSEPRRYALFLRNLREAENLDQALAATYRLDRPNLLRRWAAALASR